MGRAAVSLLLDTHAVVWWLERSSRLSAGAHDAIASALRQGPQQVFVSAASLWEAATLLRRGRLPGWPDAGHVNLPLLCLDAGFGALPITLSHAALAGGMDGRHPDPFDRMLAAQALIEDLTLISRDSALDEFGVRRIW